ncbi:GIY-YIG nuclease family protein [Streptomyces sp. NPDC014894]|uniref:GIY-YIG nuclease family protein n=1 Tax=Streptomyces sp. NPDC014894 TaxID=3364931 RepID=UPI003701CDAA
MSDTSGRRAAVLHSQDAGIPAVPGVVSSVYVVGAEGLASVKIGTSASPQQRVSQLQTGLPVTLSILAVFPGGTRLERALHEYFSAYRTRGEWFDFTPLGDPVEVVRSAVEVFGPMPHSASPARGGPGKGPVALPRQSQNPVRQTFVTVSDDEEWGLGSLVLRESVASYDASGTRTGLTCRDRALSDAFPEKHLPAGLPVQPWALDALAAGNWTLAPTAPGRPDTTPPPRCTVGLR